MSKQKRSQPNTKFMKTFHFNLTNKIKINILLEGPYSTNVHKGSMPVPLTPLLLPSPISLAHNVCGACAVTRHASLASAAELTTPREKQLAALPLTGTA